jgi:hypothetical protein
MKQHKRENLKETFSVQDTPNTIVSQKQFELIDTVIAPNNGNIQQRVKLLLASRFICVSLLHSMYTNNHVLHHHHPLTQNPPGQHQTHSSPSPISFLLFP